MADKKLITLENLSTYNDNIQDKLNSLDGRIETVENFTLPDSRASLLWLGTSIPAGEPNNNYPTMVADALGFNLYNMAQSASCLH